METTNPLFVVAELDSLEETLRTALESLESAAASLAWIESQGGPDWSGSIPSSQSVRDLAQQTRQMIHQVLESGYDEEVPQ